MDGVSIFQGPITVHLYIRTPPYSTPQRGSGAAKAWALRDDIGCARSVGSTAADDLLLATGGHDHDSDLTANPGISRGSEAGRLERSELGRLQCPCASLVRNRRVSCLNLKFGSILAQVKHGE